MFDSDVENDVIGDDDVGERRSKRQRKLTQKAAEQFAWATKSNNVGNTNKGTAKKSTMLKSNIPRNVSNHRQIIACESPIRSSQDTSRQVFAPESSSSQRIAEATATTAKSKSSQSAPIGSDTSQNIVEPQLVRSSLSQKIAEITAKSKSSQSAPIRLEDTNHQVLASEFSLSTETIAETTTKSMFSPSAPIGSDTSLNILEPQSGRSSLSQKIAEITAKSNSSQSAPIGSDTSQNILEPQLVRSSLSQKIAEITAKSNSLQSAPIRLEDTNHQVLASEFSLSTETIAETTTKSMFSPSAPIGSDTSQNILEPQLVRSSLSQKIAEITAKSKSSQSAPIGSDTSQNIVEPQSVRSSIVYDGTVYVIDRQIGSCIGIKQMKALGRKGIPEKIPSHVYITFTHFIELSKLLNEVIQVETFNPGTTKKRFKFVECHWEYDTYLRQRIHSLYSEKCTLCRSHVDKLPQRSIWWFPIKSGKLIKMTFKDFNNDITFICSLFSIRTYGVLEVELTVENVEASLSIRRNF